MAEPLVPIDNNVLIWGLSNNVRSRQILLEGLLEHAFLGSSLRDSESVSLECGLRICISDKSPGCDSVAGGAGGALRLRIRASCALFLLLVEAPIVLSPGAHIPRATGMCQAWC